MSVVISYCNKCRCQVRVHYTYEGHTDYNGLCYKCRKEIEK